MSFAKMDALMRAKIGHPGETRRREPGAQLLSQGTGCPIRWITHLPTVWFDTEYLAGLCPVVGMLLAPDVDQIKQSDSIQAPFCLQCHRCYEIGVYDPKKIVSHCLQCLPHLLGYAAAERYTQSILALSHITTSEAQGAQQGTSLSAAGLEGTDKILSLRAHNRWGSPKRDKHAQASRSTHQSANR